MIIDLRLNGTGNAVPNRIPSPNPKQEKGPGDEDSQKHGSDKGKVPLHGPREEAQDAPLTRLVHGLKASGAPQALIDHRA